MIDFSPVVGDFFHSSPTTYEGLPPLHIMSVCSSTINKRWLENGETAPGYKNWVTGIMSKVMRAELQLYIWIFRPIVAIRTHGLMRLLHERALRVEDSVSYVYLLAYNTCFFHFNLTCLVNCPKHFMCNCLQVVCRPSQPFA
jgi:hypothetical protein